MQHAATRELFQLADDALGFGLSRLMRDGPDDELRATHNAQPALLLAGYAAAYYLVRQSGKDLTQVAHMVAGHSLGEYTAITVAGGMDLPTALKLVRVRGEAMTRAVPEGQGGMLAILGMELPMVESMCRSVRVTLANDNAPGQQIVSGESAKLKYVEEEARNHGARRILPLNVAGPFHTAAMQPAAAAVQAFLAGQPLKALAVPCMMNATAALAQQPAEVAPQLVAQITSTVRWHESMLKAAAHGVREVVELGSGKVLAGLAPRCDERLAAASLDSPAAVDAWLARLG